LGQFDSGSRGREDAFTLTSNSVLR